MTQPTQALARRIAQLALDRKAIDLTVLDVCDVVSYTDFFVICTGNTDRQVTAIEDGIYLGLKHGDGGEEKLLPARVEGKDEARWILMDYSDCVVHIFTPEAREFYRLEMLWGDVPSVEIEEKVAR